MICAAFGDLAISLPKKLKSGKVFYYKFFEDDAIKIDVFAAFINVRISLADCNMFFLLLIWMRQLISNDSIICLPW